MTPAEAFAAIPLAAVCCDNSFDREEALVLQSQLMVRTPYRSMSPLAVAELIDGLLGTFRRDGWQELVRQAAPALTPEQRQTTFALAAQLVFCDRIVKPAEQDFLAGLGRELDLPAGRAEQILEVFGLLGRDDLQPA
jgi:hypothetical protein